MILCIVTSLTANDINDTLFANMDIFITKIYLDTSILAKSIIGRREYVDLSLDQTSILLLRDTSTLSLYATTITCRNVLQVASMVRC
jgi:hypothetical protein